MVDGELCGATMLCKNQLEYLFVFPHVRSRGLGRLLLQAVMNMLRHYSSQTYTCLRLECNRSLVPYYEKVGGYLYGDVKVYNGGDEYLQMTIPLL